MDLKAESTKKKIKNILPCKESYSDYYHFGWEYFGPFLYGYTRWLYRSIRNIHVDKVFFFSRDGFMMYRAFRIFNRAKINSEYVYFSRKSIRQSLLWRCDSFAESLCYLTRERYITLGKILEYYGFNIYERECIAKQYRLNLTEDYLYDTLGQNQNLQNLYGKLKPAIDKKSRLQDELLLAYLKQIHMSGDCAIVDIGWHGSMQYYLEEFFSRHNMDTRLCGFYVGIMPSIPLKGSVQGFLYSQDNPGLRKRVLCFFGGYEKLFQSMEGSVYGYEYQNHVVAPLLNQYEYEGEKELISYIREWQNGALDFVKEALSRKLQLPELDLAMPLVNFGMNPPITGVKLFSFFYNTDGTKEYYVSQKKLSEYKLKELIHALSNSVWKTGFMKSVFRLPLPYYYIYCLLRK